MSRHAWTLAALLFAIIICPLIYARDTGDRVQVGRSMIVDENEEVGDVVCVGCSIHMMGTCGDVVTVGGSIVIDGTVKGDAVTVGGGMHVGENASISGDVVTVGGHLSRHPGATIKGEITTQAGPIILLALVLIPLIPVALIVALIVWLVRPTQPQVAVRV